MKIALDNLDKYVSEISSKFKDGSIISLNGAMGAGKTTFLFHLLNEMGLDETQAFSSPTFSIHNEYQIGEKLIHHVDLYRLESFEELESLDLLDLFGKEKTLTFIEWGDKFKELAPYFTHKIKFIYDSEDNNVREIKYSSL